MATAIPPGLNRHFVAGVSEGFVTGQIAFWPIPGMFLAEYDHYVTISLIE